MISEVIVRNRGYNRTPLPFYVLVENDLAYGVQDAAGRLQDFSVDNGTVVIYNPEHIGRGIRVNWNDNIKNEIHLGLPLPCTIHDMDVLYRVTGRIMEYWGMEKFIQDGNVFILGVTDALKKSYIDFCIRNLKETRDSVSGQDICVMSAVRNPLYLSASQLVEFGEDQDMEGFSLLLHQLQERDFYYASPAVYRKQDGSFFGAYAIVADTDTVLPYIPHVPAGAKDPATDEPLVCSVYVAALNSLKRKKRLASIAYRDFLKEIDVSSMERYDEAHFILKGLDENETERIASAGYPDPLE